ncbi:MAG TPA: hypothetical protein VN682_23100 [Terriglobales bacterium]|jgi:hypothetical protein|nr:hypothetical protein [Terriglobales bacterium]
MTDEENPEDNPFAHLFRPPPFESISALMEADAAGLLGDEDFERPSLMGRRGDALPPDRKENQQVSGLHSERTARRVLPERSKDPDPGKAELSISTQRFRIEISHCRTEAVGGAGYCLFPRHAAIRLLIRQKAATAMYTYSRATDQGPSRAYQGVITGR